jgi:hypothetical protein
MIIYWIEDGIFRVENDDILDQKRLYFDLKSGYVGSKGMIFWTKKRLYIRLKAVILDQKRLYIGLKTGYFGSKRMIFLIKNDYILD